LIEITKNGTVVYEWSVDNQQYKVYSENNATIDKFFTDIVGYNYVILRPSLSFQDYFDINDDSINIDQNNNIITKITSNLTVNQLFTKIDTSADLSVINNGNQVNSNDIICTGYILRATFDNETKEYKLSVRGNVLGVGHTNVDSAKKIAKHIIDKNIIVGEEYLLAADYNDDGVIKMNDVVSLLIDIKNGE
jgi:hypothetical protein